MEILRGACPEQNLPTAQAGPLFLTEQRTPGLGQARQSSSSSSSFSSSETADDEDETENEE